MNSNNQGTSEISRGLNGARFAFEERNEELCSNTKEKVPPGRDDKAAEYRVMGARTDFDLPKYKLNTLTRIYLNAASRTPLMVETCEVGKKALARQLQTPWSIAEEEDEIKVRKTFATMINCQDKNQIAYTPSCSYAITLAAKNIFNEMAKKKMDNNNNNNNGSGFENKNKILILEDQMSSNVYPWQNLCQKSDLKLFIIKESGDNTNKTTLTDDIVNALNTNTISICAIPNVHWCSGEIIDLNKIGNICNEKHIYLVIDGTQSFGVLPFDVENVKPDFACASIHKHLFAPYGMCLLYVDQKWCDIGVPLEFHEHKRLGASGDVCLPFNNIINEEEDNEEGVTLPYEERYAPGAMRFCAGGRINPLIVPMLAHSLEKIVYTWGVLNISWLIKTFMTDEIKKVCDELGLTTVKNYHHIIGIRQVGNPEFPEQISKWLKDKVNIVISARFKYLRVAPQVYNTRREISIFLNALKEFMKLQLLSNEKVIINSIQASTLYVKDLHDSGVRS